MAIRGPYRHYDMHTRARVMAALLLGESAHVVARRTGIPRTTVRRWRREARAMLPAEIRICARRLLRLLAPKKGVA